MNSYQDYESWKQWDRHSFGSWSAVDAAYFSAELKRAGLERRPAVRLYEIGFGNGAFAGYAKSLGYEYCGSEVISTLIERGRASGLQVFEDGIREVLASAGHQSFDAVVAFDVLEHLDIADVEGFLLDAGRLLRPGGIVLARVPSGDSPFGRAVFHGDITHRTALGSSAIRQLAAKTGFEVVDIGPPRLPMLGGGWIRAMRRGGIRLAQSVVAWLINLVFHDGQARVITANLVFVLKKPAR